MKNLLFILFSLIIGLNGFEQDTINYQSLNLDSTHYYLLTKIVNTDNSEIEMTGFHPFSYRYVKSSSDVEWWGKRDIPVNLNDTMVYCDWDIEKESDFIVGHAAGTIHIDTINNLIQFKKYVWGGEKLLRKPKDRVFSIQKLIEKELVLIDVTNKNFTRQYYFIKK
jgi:hypothetical protein